jgi:hypothetical protein
MEYYLIDPSGERIDVNMAVPMVKKIVHDCPFCGKQASKGRALNWIISECIKKGDASFPCNSCGQFISIPAKMFAGKCLEELKQKSLDPRSKQVNDFVLGNLINGMKPGDLLVPDWGEVLDRWNRGARS